MRFGLLLLHHPYNLERAAWAQRSFASLARTEFPKDWYVPYVLMVTRSQADWLGGTNPFPFLLSVAVQPPDAPDCAGALVWGLDALSRYPDTTHLVLLCDDFIYNPNWLIELAALIERRPGARAWSVYRSGYNHWHYPIREDGGDVLVNCIDSCGCMMREEYLEWAPDYRVGCPFVKELGTTATLDVAHRYQRPGEYWVTRRSYIDTIGVRGLCMTPGIPTAVDFVGE